MSYQKLPESTKKIISKNANNYNKANYKQLKFQLQPEIVEKFEVMCQAEGISKTEMFRRLINNA